MRVKLVLAIGAGAVTLLTLYLLVSINLATWPGSIEQTQLDLRHPPGCNIRDVEIASEGGYSTTARPSALAVRIETTCREFTVETAAELKVRAAAYATAERNTACRLNVRKDPEGYAITLAGVGADQSCGIYITLPGIFRQTTMAEYQARLAFVVTPDAKPAIEAAIVREPVGYRQTLRRSQSHSLVYFFMTLTDDDAVGRLAMWNIVLSTLLGTCLSVFVEAVFALVRR